MRHSACRQRQHHVLDRPEAPLPLRDHRGRERARTVPRHVDLDGAGLGQHRLGPRPIAGVAGAGLSSAFVLLITEVRGHLTFERLLNHELGQLRQQPTLTIDRDTLRFRIPDELFDQRLAHDG